DYTQFIPSTLTAQAARLASRWNLMNQIKPMYNCVITNVPGPQVPLYNTGAKMLSNLGTGPVLDGVGLFHVISSYCGEFSISITSCRELMPDPDFYRQCLQDSFDALLAATVGSAPAGRKAARSKAAGKKAGARTRTKETPVKKAKAAARAKTRAAPPAAKTGRASRPAARPKRASRQRKAG
ncbi:MAG: WS/DGAT domain-containing protein, partial [Halieaceae bacterium]|nr:WS/DGAT domain-containing protein [Halieaceae bacterium]